MTEKTRQKILSACYKFLLPIARVLLANGIGYREFDDVCRRAFVESASTQFGVRGRATNTSRVAAMTGIPRKQVKELREKTGITESDSKTLLSPLADLMHQWSTNERFLDSNGKPKKLPLRKEGLESFPALVKTAMHDVPPGAVRTELLRLGVIEILDGDSVRLTRRSLVPRKAEARLESALTYSLGGLAQTIARNADPTLSETDRLFERFVESRPFAETEVQRIRSVLHQRLVEISEELDSTLNRGEPYREGSNKRIGVGIYYCE